MDKSKFELAERENFGNIECCIYRDSDSGEVFFTREQIGAALDEKISQSISGLDSKFSGIDSKVSELDTKLSEMDGKVSKVQTASSYSNYYLRCQMRSGYDARWECGQQPRLKAIAGFIGVSEKRLLCEIYAEMERRYGISLDSFVNDYKRVKKVTTCSTLSVISFSLTLREMFNAVVDEVLDACGIELPESPSHSRLLDMAQFAATKNGEPED